MLIGEHIDASTAALSEADLPVHSKVSLFFVPFQFVRILLTILTRSIEHLPVHSKPAAAEEFLLKLLAAHFLFIKLRGPKLKRLVAAMSKTEVAKVRAR